MSCGRLASAALAATAVMAAGGCGQAPSNATQTAAAPMGATPPAAINAANVPTPAANPADDHRPDKVKVEDFAARLGAEQDALMAADAAVLRDARSALQSGSQDRARLALGQYLAAINGAIAATPVPPALAGCFVRAKGPASEAAGATTAMLADRRDKAQAIAATTFRPWTLPDFGALAGDVTAGPQAADAVKASLARVRAAIADCRTAAAEPPRVAAAPPYEGLASRAAQPSTPVTTPAPSAAQPASSSGAPAASAQNGHYPPPRKPGFLERLKHAFR
jgi:hypothetical protein